MKAKISSEVLRYQKNHLIGSCPELEVILSSTASSLIGEVKGNYLLSGDEKYEGRYTWKKENGTRVIYRVALGRQFFDNNLFLPPFMIRTLPTPSNNSTIHNSTLPTIQVWAVISFIATLGIIFFSI